MSLLKLMIKEEWRFHSSIYKGRHLATLPVLVFLIFGSAFYLIQGYSGQPMQDIKFIMLAFGFFMGLGAGTAGFSSHDAVQNVLGDRSLLMFSHETLPLRSSMLVAIFMLKDILFYFGLYMLPISLAVILFAPGAAVTIGYLIAMFTAGLLITFLASFINYSHSFRTRILDYRRSALSPVTRKSMLDVLRSSGGFMKVIISILVLMGFYWYVATTIPAASRFLANPLLSFSVIFGIMAITLYNWMNTYDKAKDFTFLPLSKKMVVEQKFNAFLQVLTILIPLVVFVPYFFFGGDFMMAISLAFASAYFTGAAAAYLTGLSPNHRLMESTTLLKFSILINLFLLPLMITTMFGLSDVYILGNVVIVMGVGRLLHRKAAERVDKERWGLE